MREVDHSADRALMDAIESMMPLAKPDDRTQGTVTRIDADGTVWVRLAGADEASPCVRSTGLGKAWGYRLGHRAKPPSDHRR